MHSLDNCTQRPCEEPTAGPALEEEPALAHMCLHSMSEGGTKNTENPLKTGEGSGGHRIRTADGWPPTPSW